jgi:uncharacterized protein YdaU (DUF1376 family)
MANDSPWIKWFTGDFLTGVGAANLKADEIGVYTIVLNLIAERGRPIDDDRKWIAGQSGSTTRRCGQIIDRLIELGKLEVRGGLIGNPRMMAEVSKRDAKSDTARRAAMDRWHGAQGELKIDGKNEDKTEIKPRKNEDKVEIKSGTQPDIPQKSAENEDADACFPRARARSELRVQSLEEESVTPPKTDLMGLVSKAGRAAGIDVGPHRSASHFAAQMDAVKKWRDLGLDFDTEVIPALEADARDNPGERHSLVYYTRQFHRLAAQKEAKLNGSSSRHTEPQNPMVRAMLRSEDREHRD